MARYKTKPCEIEAFQFYVDGMPDWFTEALIRNEVKIYDYDHKMHSTDEVHCLIETLEGTMRGDVGDYIIKGLKGELYPCKPDVFEKKYERID